MKFSIVVPVYNERATAPILLEQVLGVDLPGITKEIIIVEGGSTDGTRELVKFFESRPGVHVIYEDAPGGKGAAVRKALEKVTGDFVLIQDGDLEYSVADYPKLIQALLEGKADIVFGSRALNHSQKWQYRQFRGTFERFYGLLINWGGLFYTILFNKLYGTDLSDGATMFKVFRGAHLKGMVLRSNGFDYDWEITAKLAKKGYRIIEIPVSYKARSNAEGKKIRFWRDGWQVLVAILRYRFSD